jgi:hypothetical protein
MSVFVMLSAYDRAVRAAVTRNEPLRAPVQQLADTTVAKLFTPQALQELVTVPLWVAPECAASECAAPVAAP